MNEINLTLLLNIIKNRRNIHQLRRQGLSFRQIAELIENALNDGFIVYLDKKIVLSERGETFLSKNLNTIKKTNKAEWIELDLKNKIKPFPKNEIFLPDRNELSF